MDEGSVLSSWSSAKGDREMNVAIHRNVFCALEVEAMIAAATCPWWRSMIQLGVSTGLRTTEALWLAWADCDFAAMAITLTCEPVSYPAGGDIIPRPELPLHRRRIVPMSSHVADSLCELRDRNSRGAFVFIPDWKIDQLWLDIYAGHPVRPDRIAPGLYGYFRYVQRCARLWLARRLGIELAALRWSYRPLSALRNTYAATLAGEVRPTERAGNMGVARLREFLGYFDISAATTGGTA